MAKKTAKPKNTQSGQAMPSGAKEVKTRTAYNVTPQQFITAWETSNTAQEVADKLGMPKLIVLARASSYRQDGIHLKKMRRDHKRALDVDALNRLIEQLNAGGSTEESPPRKVQSTIKKMLREKDKK